MTNVEPNVVQPYHALLRAPAPDRARIARRLRRGVCETWNHRALTGDAAADQNSEATRSVALLVCKAPPASVHREVYVLDRSVRSDWSMRTEPVTHPVAAHRNVGSWR